MTGRRGFVIITASRWGATTDSYPQVGFQGPVVPTVPDSSCAKPPRRASSSPLAVCAQCYVESGYVEAAELVHGLIEWVPFSTYVVAIDADEDEIVGTPIIRPSVRGLRSNSSPQPMMRWKSSRTWIPTGAARSHSPPEADFKTASLPHHGFVWREQ